MAERPLLTTPSSPRARTAARRIAYSQRGATGDQARVVCRGRGLANRGIRARLPRRRTRTWAIPPQQRPRDPREPVYLNIVPDRRIVMVYTMAFDGKNISASLGNVEFETVGAGTRLIYTEQGAFFDGADGPSSRKQGWNGLLERLAAALG